VPTEMNLVVRDGDIRRDASRGVGDGDEAGLEEGPRDVFDVFRIERRLRKKKEVRVRLRRHH
jgi:hypothetical protein